MEYLFDLLANLHWAAVGQIIMIDILLGGDNAVVIAMACRNLPESQRNKGIFWGTAGAIALRVVLITCAVMLLDLPFLKVAGGALLVWIGAKLLLPEDGDHEKVEGSSKLIGAIKTIIVADFVMSFDNVIAIAGAAQQAHEAHQTLLIIFGLLVSVPFIVFGSQIILKLIDRFPAIIYFGAGLLGWIAGGRRVRHDALARTGLHDALPALRGLCGARDSHRSLPRQGEDEEAPCEGNGKGSQLSCLPLTQNPKKSATRKGCAFLFQAGVGRRSSSFVLLFLLLRLPGQAFGLAPADLVGRDALDFRQFRLRQFHCLALFACTKPLFAQVTVVEPLLSRPVVVFVNRSEEIGNSLGYVQIVGDPQDDLRVTRVLCVRESRFCR